MHNLLIDHNDYTDMFDCRCTDDFCGPSPHNSNLAAKGIVGLGAYAKLMKQKGDIASFDKYMAVAKNYSFLWAKYAVDSISPLHYKLQYDKSNTWSLKYNLVWDLYLGLGVYPQSVLQAELPYYLSKSEKYGLPLDNRLFGGRNLIAKWDWICWVTAIARGTPGQGTAFSRLVDMLWLFANETTSRVPLTDWFYPVSGTQVGFQARPVVGAIFMIPLVKPV